MPKKNPSQADLVLVRLEDLKQAVRDGQVDLKTDIATVHTDIASTREEVHLARVDAQTAIDRYSQAHDKIHAQLEDSLKERDQRFWAAVGILTTILLALAAIIAGYFLKDPVTSSSAIYVSGVAAVIGAAVTFHAKLSVALVGFAEVVGASRPGQSVIGWCIRRRKSKP